MGAMSKLRKPPFYQKTFKKEVNKYYGLTEKHRGATFSGFNLPASVRAAHLVPKIPSPEEVSHIFGVEDGVLSDPRNDNESRNVPAGMILRADIREIIRAKDHTVGTSNTRNALIECIKRLERL
ncbi:uncharacterized protein N7479_001402 [Penicillium vulpinum]|uniref:Uncharacterized protein n=1 Tax=Penicillium vulpinum TaxID=29845 RepID=A0A1V6RTT7_9EURO|nr:uncharacterized protein N7479_001402 [Penicillium vulpinum]KAJ5971484.1 hypothetical protein N7479_001402 [Penicillium vulpinum]OQE05181.1 hypothetical protein PENVUL_c026G10350 [Penicillium vulpinum]